MKAISPLTIENNGASSESLRIIVFRAVTALILFIAIFLFLVS